MPNSVKYTIILPIHQVKTGKKITAHLRVSRCRKHIILLHPVLNDRLKAPGDLLGDRDLPLTGIRLGGLDHILHFGSALKLMVDIDDTVLQVNVFQRQTAEF